MIIIELALSNRSKCKKCGRLISKDLPRIRNSDWNEFSVCFNCGEGYLKGEIKKKEYEIDRLNKDLENWKNILKEHSKEIVLNRLK